MADLKIASMNVRGIGNNNKGRETFNCLRNNSNQLSFCKTYTVWKQLLASGDLNGATCTKLSLVASQATQQESALSSFPAGAPQGTRLGP